MCVLTVNRWLLYEHSTEFCPGVFSSWNAQSKIVSLKSIPELATWLPGICFLYVEVKIDWNNVMVGCMESKQLQDNLLCCKASSYMAWMSSDYTRTRGNTSSIARRSIASVFGVVAGRPAELWRHSCK